MQFLKVEKPHSWKIVKSSEAETDTEELVLSFQGVIVSKTLPPFKTKVAANKKHFLRQSVQLTGLSTPSFQTCIDNLQHIHTAFGRHVPEGELESFRTDMFLDHPCVDIATRYYTSRREDPTGTAVPFSPDVDPNGTLQAMITDDHFHGVDNQVLYYTLIGQEGRKQHRRPTNPGSFRTGDIVEVQTTISIIQVKKDRFRMILNPHTLAMLDSGPSVVSAHMFKTQEKTEAHGNAEGCIPSHEDHHQSTRL
ncbi:hypothetical protein PILCRDRAFT_74520 [Piloderma croceum F 1598]|uniref:Uncharacterized protein n=1 Tax=Piloderma croceum (strain F 1598) TaxID=765440 RepID=A0A0C3FIA9_PILCF|nr:hypothetical protein PILCRDRAFT_74520 [Piloderma croceum F 1598]